MLRIYTDLFRKYTFNICKAYITMKLFHTSVYIVEKYIPLKEMYPKQLA